MRSYLQAMLAFSAMAGGFPDGRTATEKAIDSSSIRALVKEYNLIRQKKSRLTRSQRNRVEGIVEHYVRNGSLIQNEDGSVSMKITEVGH